MKNLLTVFLRLFSFNNELRIKTMTKDFQLQIKSVNRVCKNGFIETEIIHRHTESNFQCIRLHKSFSSFIFICFFQAIFDFGEMALKSVFQRIGLNLNGNVSILVFCLVS